MDLFQIIAEYGMALSMYGALLSLLSIVLVLINTFKTSKIIQKYKRLMRGVDNKNLEALLAHHLDSLQGTITKVAHIESTQDRLAQQLKKCMQGVGVVRYNPFEKMGSDMSFSIALLDAHDDGVVISGLFGRESSSTYAKPITGGNSIYPLSDEETQAIRMARK